MSLHRRWSEAPRLFNIRIPSEDPVKLSPHHTVKQCRVSQSASTRSRPIHVANARDDEAVLLYKCDGFEKLTVSIIVMVLFA